MSSNKSAEEFRSLMERVGCLYSEMSEENEKRIAVMEDVVRNLLLKVDSLEKKLSSCEEEIRDMRRSAGWGRAAGMSVAGVTAFSMSDDNEETEQGMDLVREPVSMEENQAGYVPEDEDMPEVMEGGAVEEEDFPDGGQNDLPDVEEEQETLADAAVAEDRVVIDGHADGEDGGYHPVQETVQDAVPENRDEDLHKDVHVVEAVEETGTVGRENAFFADSANGDSLTGVEREKDGNATAEADKHAAESGFHEVHAFHGFAAGKPEIVMETEDGRLFEQYSLFDAGAHGPLWKTDMPGPYITHISHGITINDKIRYINELFAENADIYRDTVEHIDSLSTFAEAESYLRARFPQWRDDDDAVYGFYMTIRRKLRK